MNDDNWVHDVLNGQHLLHDNSDEQRIVEHEEDKQLEIIVDNLEKDDHKTQKEVIEPQESLLFKFMQKGTEI